MKGFFGASVLALLFCAQTLRAESFTVDEIEVIGAKKISIGTVLNYLPINVGEQLDENRSPDLIRELYSTGFFEYIELIRDGNTLIVKLRERPSIAEINIEGNEEIDDESLDRALDQIGMTRGKIFNELQLSKLELELQQLYYSLGKYAVRLKADWRYLDDDRVVIDINISEGEAALIRSINMTGNLDFDDETLLDNFELESSDDGWFASDEYSSSKFIGDLENLKSFYLDQGYLQFNVDSKQVTISPDRKDIDITININEGQQYVLSDISMAGELVVAEVELMALVAFREGEIFSRKKVTQAARLITKRLGQDGYTFANVRPIPEIDEDNNTVSLKFLINPGKKMMVRFINFSGNDRTRDFVLRREMRQLEGELYSASKIDRSKLRLQRLNYIASVKILPVRVKDRDDQLDLNITVSERFSGSFQIGLGYSQTQGALINLGLTHENVFGTGKTVSITFDNSAASGRYEFRYLNPYYTLDGISRGFSFSFTETDSSENNVSNYFVDRFSLAMDFGIPLSEFNRLNLNFGLIRNKITTSLTTASEVIDFIIDNSEEFTTSNPPTPDDDVQFDSFFSSVSFSKDTRNRRIFASRGALNSIRLELFAGDLDFYKIRYSHRSAFELTDNLTLAFRSQIGFGDSYKETTDLPFFEKFTVGGVRSVRGYDRNSLGPLDSQGNPFGGNLQVITTIELLLPVESLGSSETFRLGLYFDAGNVFADADSFEFSQLRQSVGLSAKWFSLVGPLEFSYAFPINDEPGDDIRQFQFALGAAF